MLDSDVAFLYGYTTKRLNEVVKRNQMRFPENFCFRLTEEEFESLRSHFATSKNSRGGRTNLPYVFTEHGVSMLAGLLKSDVAVKASINIINAFVEMRKFIQNNADVFNRLTKLEYNYLEHDNKINYILDEMNPKEIKEKIFYNGEIYDAYSLLINIIREAKNKIIIIDNYIDKTIFDILSYKDENIKVEIWTNTLKSKLDYDKFNLQYENVEIKKVNNIHDRFIIIDDNKLYHVGASLKDLGKKCFAITKMNKENINYLIKKYSKEI